MTHSPQTPPERPRRSSPPQLRARSPEGGSGRTLDQFDRALLEYVLCWAPYGGPPDEDIVPSFGILAHELPGRVNEIASCGRRQALSFDERVLVARALATVERTCSTGNGPVRTPARWR